MDKKGIKTSGVIAGYIAAVVFAIYIRTLMIPWFPNGFLQNLPDSDAARFYRMVELIIHDYPSLPIFDSFANYPQGMIEQLPPLWAFVEASFAALINSLTGLSIESAVSVFPVLAGLACAIPAYYAGKSLFGVLAGHMSAMVAMFAPIPVIISSAGMVDHHVADMALYLVILSVTLSAYRYYSKGRNFLAAAISVFAGICVSFMLMVSISSVLMVIVLEVAFLISVALLSDNNRSYVVKIGIWIMVTSGSSMYALSLLTNWFEDGLSFSGLSLLQPLILMAMAFILIIARMIDILLRRQGLIRISALLGFYIILTVSALIFPGVGSKVTAGFYRSIALYPLGQITMQLKPIFAGPIGDNIILFGGFTFLAPLTMIYVIRKAISEKCIDFGHLLYLVWFIIAGIYAVFVSYYVILFLPMVVVSIGLLMAKPGEVIRAITMSFSVEKEGVSRSMNMMVSVTMLISLLFIWFAPRITSETAVSRIEMYAWIKDNTPKVEGYLEPKQKPEYGILTHWSTSEQLQLLARRPVMATGNHETGIQGIITSQRVLQESSEQKAVSILADNDIRYVLLDNEFPICEGYALWKGDMAKIGEAGLDAMSSVRPVPVKDIPKIEYSKLFNVRLYRDLGRGVENQDIEPMQRLRLINITGQKDNKDKVVLFELVKGATLSVVTKPNVEVEVMTKVTTQKNGSFSWRLKRNSGPTGEAGFVLPYANAGGSYPVKAGPYRLSFGKKVTFLSVSENDVTDGRYLKTFLK